MFSIKDMTEDYANEINTWVYEPPYESYSFDGDEDEFEQIMSGYYFAVINKEELVGFMALGPAAQKMTEENESLFEDETYTDIALGLKPSLTGNGMGSDFIDACIRGAREIFPEDVGTRICVMNDNIRAVKLYRRKGFEEIYKDSEFMVMIMKKESIPQK